MNQLTRQLAPKGLALLAPRAQFLRSFAAASSAAAKEPLVLVTTPKPGVRLLTMNNPKKYNGWTAPMVEEISQAMRDSAADKTIKVTILTGADPYYCAGVDLSGTIKLMPPKQLHDAIYTMNVAVFDKFLVHPHPMIIAINGPAIGASVTTATLCDIAIASEKATLSTPFHRLGVPPEGCSSVHFYTLMGKVNAERMLGKEGWAPTGKEAVECGLIDEVTAHDNLVPRAIELAQGLIDQGDARTSVRFHRTVSGADGMTEKLREINRKESAELATAFLSVKFLGAQAKFLESKGKTVPATVFKLAVATRPIWSKFM